MGIYAHAKGTSPFSRGSARVACVTPCASAAPYDCAASTPIIYLYYRLFFILSAFIFIKSDFSSNHFCLFCAIFTNSNGVFFRSSQCPIHARCSTHRRKFFRYNKAREFLLDALWPCSRRDYFAIMPPAASISRFTSCTDLIASSTVATSSGCSPLMPSMKYFSSL